MDPADAQAISNWIRLLGRTLTQAGLYQRDHPTVRASLDACHRELTALLRGRGDLVLHVTDNRVCVGGEPLDDLGPLGREMVALYERHRLDSVTFKSHVTREDLEHFVQLMAGRPDAGFGENAVARWLVERGVTTIECNTAVYAKVRSGDETLDPSLASASGSGDGEADAEQQLAARVGEAGLESSLTMIVKRAIHDPDVQRQVFELVMTQIQRELESKVHDATRQLETEKQQVVFEKRRTEEVVSAAAEGLVVVDAQGRIVMMNSAAERLYGAKLKDSVGRHVREVLGGEQMVTLSKELTEAVPNEASPTAETAGAPETEKTLRASTALVQNQEGKVVGMVSALSNVTKTRELEQMKVDFVANVSHELRTPLASVKQALALVLDQSTGAVTSEQEKMLSLAQRNVERLTRLINDILDFSKLEAGKLVVHREAHDLADIVEEVGRTMALFAQSRKVSLDYQAGRRLPKVDVDRDRIIQVLTNLVGNAVKFTPAEGTVHLQATDPPAGTAPPPFIKVAVADTGRGIAKEDVPRIFEKFVQVGGKSTDVRGTGLGLPIAKSLIELHGGRMWVESEVGKGSKFTISLPVYRERPSAAPDSAAPVARKRSWFARFFGARAA